ncbi:MAG TPA: ABC transporter ATP-binding protein [Candidatus Cloacimonadota bacterium]|nr:ABC transporter ATP-binding protein [Candidatus Cloacimonadota bacterium]
MTAIMEIKNLNKYFGKFQALKDVNLSIPQGRIIGLLGKNGAGKSTLMRCMLGFLKYQGEILYHETPIEHNDTRMFKKIAFIPDVSALDERLTVQQTIDYVRGINPSWNDQKADSLMEKSDLPMKKKVKTLSKGMKTKLYLLLVLSLDVEFLLLDEPTIGLDIVFRKEFFNTILGEFFDETKTIIISTHQVDEVEHILQDIIFLDQGEVILFEDIEELKMKYKEVKVPREYMSVLMQHNPLQVWEGLGFVHALVHEEIDVPEAEYATPQLVDLFLAKIGGRS